MKRTVARVSTSNDNDILVLRREVHAVLEVRIEERAGVHLEELHRWEGSERLAVSKTKREDGGVCTEVNAVKVAVRHLEISRPGGASRHHDSVVVLAKLSGVDRDSN
jgi:hypothetical protein